MILIKNGIRADICGGQIRRIQIKFQAKIPQIPGALMPCRKPSTTENTSFHLVTTVWGGRGVVVSE